MGRAMSEEGKKAELRGSGSGASYRPWVKIREINSSGTATSFPDWKHGRMVELLSQTELWCYVLLRWRDDVVDIREHYPLDVETTSAIAKECGIRPAMNGRRMMNTDFLVTMADGSLQAFSAKSDRCSLERNERAMQLQLVEKLYWNIRSVSWGLIFKEDINPTEVRNILDVVGCYDSGRVHDDFSYIRHLIAHKKITVDMTRPIDYRAVVESYRGGGM